MFTLVMLTPCRPTTTLPLQLQGCRAQNSGQRPVKSEWCRDHIFGI